MPGDAIEDPAGLRVSPRLTLPWPEIVVRATTSGGPGGQHANVTRSAVVVSFDVRASAALGPRQRERLLERLGPVVRATSADTRSQTRNRAIALDRLRTRIAEALRRDPPRRPTRPGPAARRARVEDKRRRGEVKRGRGRPASED
ncbi:MAG: alternative ribosome rescue aminoacyl-tRNA hydrolase ArfB [Actinomycetes bacterium]